MSSARLRLIVLALSLTLLPHLAWAAIVNRTIDDSSGDSLTGLKPEFLPKNVSGLWKDQTCSDCRINPDVRLAFGNSYTAATYSPQLGRMSIVIPFNGTAIYVFFILANDAGPGITTRTECNFVLNSESPVPYRHEPNQTTTAIQYNQLVFSRTGLPQRQHTLQVVTEGYDYDVYVAFDYAIYTHDDSPPKSSNTTTGATTSTTANSGQSQGGTSNNGKVAIGPIVGGVVGAILLIIGAIFLFFCLRRRSKQKKIEEYHQRPPPLMDELDPQNRVDPFIQTGAYHRGPASSTLAGSNREPLYSPVPQQTQNSLQGGQPALPWGAPTPSEYSSAYTGIAPSSRNHPDSDRATSAAGSSVGGGTLYNTGASSSSASAPISTYPSEKRNRAAPNPLPPLPAGSSRVVLGVTNPEAQEQVRQVRQAEIGERLRTVEAEMNDLKRGVSTRRQPRRENPQSDGADMIAQMREQMAMMQQEIQTLRENQRSDWAMGLTDEPPPGYTASPTSHSSPPGSMHPS